MNNERPRFERERETLQAMIRICCRDLHHSATVDADLLFVLQKGLPLAPDPFAVIGKTLGLSGDDVLKRVRVLFETGVARRFGAVFDSRSLGYESTLCAVEVPVTDLVAAAARIQPHPGITHCYERQGHPNLWFTLTAPANDLLPELARISKALGPYGVLNLPALQKFKIEAVFGQSSQGNQGEGGWTATSGRGQAATGGALSETPPGGRRPPEFSEREKRVIRCLQGSIPVEREPFSVVAGQVGVDPGEFLELLQRWQQEGIIRRIALVVRHHKLGFAANSMCVWQVAPEVLVAAGQSMARSPHVTHCYERPSSPAFPYNLYAMIHARTREEAVSIFKTLGRDAGLPEGAMMWSIREFKKASPIFFCESTVELGVPPS
jgi:DNA-binding Lrp family transcriptional regulator